MTAIALQAVHRRREVQQTQAATLRPLDPDVVSASIQSALTRCALVFPTETFELDIENRGNPLIVLAARLLRG